MRRQLLTLTATVVLAVGSAGATAAVAEVPHPQAGSGTSGESGTSISSSTRGKAEKRAIRKCRKIKKRPRRRSCVKRVKRKFSSRPAPSQGPVAATVDVRDKYFSPDVVSIRKGEAILWVWSPLNKDAHNVNLVDGPPGVKRIDFSTPSSPSLGFEFKRTFTVPGTYSFVCSIHYNMTMRVEVSK